MSSEEEFNIFSERVPVDIERMRLVKINQIEMMRLRGYEIEDFEENISRMSSEDFYDLWMKGWYVTDFIIDAQSSIKTDKENRGVLQSERFFLSYHYRKTDENYTCVVFYITRDNPQGRVVKSLMQPLIGYSVARYMEIVIITSRDLTAGSRRLISSIPPVVISGEEEKIIPRKIQIFKDQELYINPLLHMLSPIHEKLDNKEAIAFKKLYRNPVLISIEDPIVKFNGWNVSDVIKITRDISNIEGFTKMMISKRLVVRDNLVKDIIKE